MTRGVDTDTGTALNSSYFIAANFVKMDFPAGALRLWTGVGTVTFLSESYVGTGNLGQISEIEETMDLRAAGISLSLSGIPSELLSKVLQENIRNRSIKVWFAVLDSELEIEGDEILVFDGTMDTLSIDDQGESSVIQVTAESRMIDLGRPRTQVYTDEFQRTIDATDNSLEYLADLANKANGFRWG